MGEREVEANSNEERGRLTVKEWERCLFGTSVSESETPLSHPAKRMKENDSISVKSLLQFTNFHEQTEQRRKKSRENKYIKTPYVHEAYQFRYLRRF